MILIFEFTSDGTGHVPVNRALTRTIAQAFPHSTVRFHGMAAHLESWRHDPALARVEFREITLSAHHRWRTHIVSARRFWHEFVALWQAMRGVPQGEPVLIVLASASSTAIQAAMLVARLAGRPVGIQVGLHGNLNDAFGWRPRNPFRRWFDLRAMLGRNSPRLRFLVLEECIQREMARLLPHAAARTDVLPHPLDSAEAIPPPPLCLPIRVGLVGMATASKGIDAFLDTARMFRARYGDAIEFHIVGGRPHTTDASRFIDIAHPVETGHIPRAAFCARLALLHYVFLPLDASYYTLSPSGGLIDALAWARPVITTRLALAEDMFREGGDIGHLCDDPTAMQAALHAIMTLPDAARYQAQHAALASLRARREPDALAVRYRFTMLPAYPWLDGRSTPGIGALLRQA